MCADGAWDRVPFIDSHTGGEPTRVVLSGGPELGDGPLSARLQRLRSEHDAFRSAVVNEPRGSDVMVGALLCPPVAPSAAAGVIFFNNVGYLGMCGHGTIGLVTTLAHMGRIGPGRHVIETPVGDVQAELHGDGSVSVHNVPARRHAKDVTVSVEFEGKSVTVSGDVAWGGNWFFLSGDAVERLGLTVLPHDIERLTDAAWRIRQALAAAGVTGDGVTGGGASGGGAEIDHVELFVAGSKAAAGNSAAAGSGAAAGHADARSFVLCPGKAYDRSPCGTGTSAKLACLAADGLLAPGEPWVQESVIGSRFTARYALGGAGEVLPVITGRAHVMASGELLFDVADPFRSGIA